MVPKPEVRFVPRDSVAANSGGAVILTPIVLPVIARVSVLVALVPVLDLQGTSAVSSQIPCLIRCLSIAMIMPARERVISIVTMHSSLLQALFLALVLLVISLPVKGKLLLSLLKPLMKLLEDGLRHQMDHTHGDTVSLENKVAQVIIAHQAVNGLVLLEENISEEAPFKFHTTTTMGRVEEPSEWTS